MKKLLYFISITAIVLLSVADFSDARSGGSRSGGFSSSSSRSGGFSGSRSGGFSSSRSSSPSKPSSGFSSSKSSSSSGSSWGSGSLGSKQSGKVGSFNASTGRKTVTSSADSKLAESAKKNGTNFSTRSDAVSSFKSKNADKYTNKFSAEPSTRPSYIPNSTTIDGRSYNVVYNSSYGGYGYYNAMGTWMMYDAMSDALMLSVLMDHDNYYYPGMYDTVHQHNWTVVYIFLVIMVVIVIACAIKVMASD